MQPPKPEKSITSQLRKRSGSLLAAVVAVLVHLPLLAISWQKSAQENVAVIAASMSTEMLATAPPEIIEPEREETLEPTRQEPSEPETVPPEAEPTATPDTLALNGGNGDDAAAPLACIGQPATRCWILPKTKA